MPDEEQEGYTLLYYSSFISFSVKPIIKAICSMLNPLSSILRAILFFSLALPSSNGDLATLLNSRGW